jgi:catalase-peroxidase
LLQAVKDQYGDSLSWADLIVLAGNTGLEDATSKAGSSLSLSFVGGRSDQDPSNENPTPEYLESRLTGGQSDDTIDIMKDVMNVMGLTAREYVALIGGGHTLGQMHQNRSGFVDGAWTTTPALLNTEFFQNLLNLDWSQELGDDQHIEYQSVKVLEDGSSTPVYMLLTDLNLRSDGEFRAAAQDYASNATLFYAEFAKAWTKVMTADLDGVTQEDGGDTSSDSGDDDDSALELSSGGLIGFVVGIIVILAATIVVAFLMGKNYGLKTADENRLTLSLVSNEK